MDALFWDAEDGSVRCRLCPHNCSIGVGKFGLCRVRKNEGDRLVLPAWSRISGMGMDPIEKKPLYHFLPGSKIFSVGFFGCNLRCPFCQNWEISQTSGEESTATKLEPSELVAAVLRSGSPSIAFTYSEPLVHFEFLKEAARLAKQTGLYTVLVTNGYIEKKPAAELLPLLDAVNVDLKCFSETAYRNTLGGELRPVLQFIEASAARCHVETTTLIVPGLSDSNETISSISDFLATLSTDLVLHVSAYHPAYRCDARPIDSRRFFQLCDIAKERLRYVYSDNISSHPSGIGSDTRCPNCGLLLIERRGYSIRISPSSLLPSDDHSRCASCATELPVRLR